MKTFKKLTLAFVAFILFTNVYSQDKFDTYDNSLDQKTYEILIDKEKASLYIDAMSLDKLHNIGGILVSEKHYEGFINSLKEARNKYEEWSNTAKQNNVTEFEKRMSFETKSSAYFKYGSKWQFQFLVFLKYDFKVFNSNDEIKHMLIVRTGELKSSSNQFMKVDGVVLVFYSVKEIDSFLEKISKERIDNFIKSESKDSLFKD